MIKLVFFDMEGTIYKKAHKESFGNTAPSLWNTISNLLGEDCAKEELETNHKWNRGEYTNYFEWMEETLIIFKKYGLSKKQFDEAASKIDLHNGVEEVFSELRKHKIITALVSGGFKSQADRAQKLLKIDHAVAACEIFWGNDGSMHHWNFMPSDYQGKLDIMKLVMNEWKLKPEECAFVGDGINDVTLAKAVGLSISFNGAPELDKVSTHSIKQEEGKEDFRAVLKLLDI